MTTMEMAKQAFASRRAVDAWFKDAAPNFEAFAEMVRKDEREACANIAELCDDQESAARFIRARSNVELTRLAEGRSGGAQRNES